MSRKSKTGRSFMQGNEAVVEGAIAAGCRFYAGYPITPSSEIAERFSTRMLEEGGIFIQMEDELSSVSAIIGASLAGVKALTATSGPGFCLMQENIGCATMMEVPCVIVDVQRPGPSGGLATVSAQGDLMQARWGRNGDQELIILSPASVQECYDYTVKAFNLSEQFRIPVVLLSDEATGHLRENLIIPAPESVEVVNRRQPDCPPEEFQIFRPDERGVPALPYFGGDYLFDVTSTSHTWDGVTTSNPQIFGDLVERLRNKLEENRQEICITKQYYPQGEMLDVLFITFGCTTRATRAAALRCADKKVGTLQLVTLWPLPVEQIKQACTQAKHVVVAELNLGQLALDIERIITDRPVHRLGRNNGTVFTPSEVLDYIREVTQND